MHTEFGLGGGILENDYLEDQERDSRITSRRIS
jgi:hypothetical protein